MSSACDVTGGISAHLMGKGANVTTSFTPSSYSYLWRMGLSEAIEDLAAAGFEQVELMAALPHIDLWHRGRELASEIATASRRTGLRVAGLNPPGLDINIGSPDDSMRAWSVDMYVRIGQLAADVSAAYLVVHPGRRHVLVPAPAPEAREWVIDSVARIADALAPAGVRVLFENTPTRLLDTAEECMSVVHDLSGRDVGLVYDVANGFMVEDPAAGLRVVAEHVDVVHVSDTTAAHWRHDPIGNGEVDFGAVAEVLADVGRRPDVVLETVHDVDIRQGLDRDCRLLQAAGFAA